MSLKLHVEEAIRSASVPPDRVKIMPGASPEWKPPSKETSQERPNEHNKQTEGWKYILYWVSTSARLEDNPTLAMALALSKKLSLPVVALATIDLSILRKASIRLVTFILEGLSDFSSSMASKGIKMFVRIDPNCPGAHASPSVSGFSAEESEKFGSKQLPSAVEQHFPGFSSGASIIVTDKVHEKLLAHSCYNICRKNRNRNPLGALLTAFGFCLLLFQPNFAVLHAPWHSSTCGNGQGGPVSNSLCELCNHVPNSPK